MDEYLSELAALAWDYRRRGLNCCAQQIEQIMNRLKEIHDQG